MVAAGTAAAAYHRGSIAVRLGCRAKGGDPGNLKWASRDLLPSET
jgi:hypothetical protein